MTKNRSLVERSVGRWLGMAALTITFWESGVSSVCMAAWEGEKAVHPPLQEEQSILPDKPASLELTGEIERVDPSQKLVVIKLPGVVPVSKEIHFESHDVTREGKTIRLSDLKPGETVRVSYAEKDGKLTAHTIETVVVE